MTLVRGIDHKIVIMTSLDIEPEGAEWDLFEVLRHLVK